MSENLLVLFPYIDIHTHRMGADDDVIAVYSLRLGKECADGVPHPFWAGVHPWDCDTVERDAVLQLHRMDIYGVGEIGLDRTRGDIALQRLFFDEQLAVAAERDLPVALHAVRTSEEIIAAVRKSGVDRSRVMVHGFVGGKELAQRYLGEGYILSVGGRTLASEKGREAVAGLPEGRFLTETDGEGHIRDIYGRVADVRGCSVEELRGLMYDTYRRLFGRLSNNRI